MRFRKRTRRRRVTKRYRRFSRKSRMSSRKTEVKYATFSVVGAAIKQMNLPIANITAAADDLSGPASTNGFLGIIGLGTGANQRIGNKINIVKCVLTYNVYLCPGSGDTNSYDVTQVRLMAPALGQQYGGSDTTDFWYNGLTTHIAGRPRRSNYKIYLDKTITLAAATPITGPTRAGKGVMRTYKYTLSRRGPMEYKDGSTEPKYANDKFVLYHFAFSPSVANGTQMVCANYSFRVYFTDI